MFASAKSESAPVPAQQQPHSLDSGLTFIFEGSGQDRTHPAHVTDAGTGTDTKESVRHVYDEQATSPTDHTEYPHGLSNEYSGSRRATSGKLTRSSSQTDQDVSQPMMSSEGSTQYSSQSGGHQSIQHRLLSSSSCPGRIQCNQLSERSASQRQDCQNSLTPR